MNEQKIPITKPYFSDDDYNAIRKTLESGWVVQGPNVKKFEDLFVAFTGCKYAVATTSCTTALHLGLLAAGIGPGDEVIIPSFTFIATANSVEYCGARPIFCDIDLHTFNIDVQKVESLITSKTKAIIPVSLFGLPADLNAIEDICKKHNLILFEDAACAIGAKINGKHVGNWGIGAAFSFHPRKAITTGEGGMFATNDQTLADTVRSLRDHGASKSDLQRHTQKGGSLLPEYNMLGYNYRMTDIQGALGVSQMGKLDEILSGRIRGSNYYNEVLRDVPFVIAPFVPQGFIHAFQSYVVLLTDVQNKWPQFEKASELNRKRNALMGALELNGITVRQGTHAIHTLGYYKAKYRLQDSDFPNSFMADRLSVTLPLFYNFSKEEALHIHDSIMEIYKQSIRSL